MLTFQSPCWAVYGGWYVEGFALSSRPTELLSMTVKQLLLSEVWSDINVRHTWVACETALLKVNNGVRVCAQPTAGLRDFLCRRNAADVDYDLLQHQSRSATPVENE